MVLEFTLGCFSASAVEQLAVPALEAYSTATKWEQTCVHAKSQGIDTSTNFAGTSNTQVGFLNDPRFKDSGDVVKEWGAQETLDYLDACAPVLISTFLWSSAPSI